MAVHDAPLGVPIVDTQNGLVTREWFNWFILINSKKLETANLDDLETEIETNQNDIASLQDDEAKAYYFSRLF